MATYTQYADASKQVTGEYPSSMDVEGRLHVMHAKFTQTATTIGQAILECECPPLLMGKVAVYPHLSWLRADDADVNANLSIGYRAYTNSSGVVVVADDDYWIVDADVGGGALQGAWSAITGVSTAGAQPAIFDAQDGLKIVITVDTAMPNATDVIEVVVVYSHIN